MEKTHLNALAKNPLFDLFKEFESTNDFAFFLAIDSFETIQKNAANQEEVYEHLLEDIVYSSLAATFFEELGQKLHENPKLAQALVEQFEKDSENRDQLILSISESHIDYIKNGGTCAGCVHCEFHHDVDELIPHWEKRDGDFLATLFIGMQTIQFTMEQLLYEVLPLHGDQLPAHMDRETILDLRQKVFGYVEEKLK